MNKLTANDLIKIASISPKGKEFVLHLAKVAAGDASSEFNETVPAMNTEQLEADKASMPSQGPGNQQQPPPPMEQPPAEEQAPMEGMQQEETPEDIGARAAQSFIGPEIMQAAVSGEPGAQDLIARTAGQVAGAVAEAAARSMGSEEMPAEGEVPMEDGGMAPGMEQGMAPGAGGMAPAVATPEEDLANEIVPPAAPAQQAMPNGQVQPGGQVPPEQMPQQGNEEGAIDQGKGPQTVVNPEAGPAPAQPGAPAQAAPEGGGIAVEDVKKLLDLAKSGQI